MTINSALHCDKPTKKWVKTSFYAIAVIFNLCLIAQLLTVGIAYFNDSSWWTVHVLFVRGYAVLSLILLVASLIVPCSQRVRALATSLPLLLGLQFGSIHLSTPLHLEILHPLIGFSLVYVSSTLVHRLHNELAD